ncbi:MAG: hypothetical protein JWO54_814 [Candidatus Saccharibacteria bacterium]|nr:hypothetical protein [Candidatus Saccharibacteria bacterium]
MSMNSAILTKLSNALRNSWSAETSNSDKWNKDNPPMGQCAVTACVVQDYLGGEIINVLASDKFGNGVSHYLNVINGETVDLTRSQFSNDVAFGEPRTKTGNYSTTREYCLSFLDTNKRYEILASKVSKLI